ncbi:hypothetical protein JKP88DRAFT_354246 [Tribonema minus]|uniref:JmjC domain-containing protein n=1 Tax=Tribonema minus TaxID=303371 RepID=A0A836CH09_9STRA|nr:hypothetical protein JKP88DRAFT_354246 [Tribonema minus]
MARLGRRILRSCTTHEEPGMVKLGKPPSVHETEAPAALARVTIAGDAWGFAEVTDLEEQPSVATAATAPVRKKHWLAAPGTTRPVRDVPMIDSNELDAFDKVSQMRIDGTPCILVGATGWAGFAEPWLRAGGDGSQELDVDRFYSQLGDADVPVVERNHDFNQPLSRTMKLRDFVHEAWQRDSPGLYLHQWQFPASPALARALTSQPGAHVHSPALGVDLLDHCRHSGKGSGSSGGGGGGRADVQQQQPHALPNPLQYLFMGAASTRTRLHFDDGGLAITIMPIVGKKECWLVHRDDGDKVANGAVDVANGEVDVRAPDLHRFPRFAAARVWHAVLKPGQVLVMPHGTWHACRNATPCLSYTRLHLDEVNLQAFGDALIRGESPEVCDKRLLWNAAEWLISQVDKATKRAHKQAQAAAARRLACADCRTANVQCSHTSNSGQQPQQCITVGSQGGACRVGGGSSCSRSGPADACCCCGRGQHGGSGGAACKGSGGSAASSCGRRPCDDDGSSGAARAGANGDNESNCSDSTSVSARETTTRGSSRNLTGQCGSTGAKMLATVDGDCKAIVLSAAPGEERSGCDDAARSGGSCSRACGSANALLSGSTSAVAGRGGTAGRGGGGRKRALMMLRAHNSTPSGSVERMRGRRSGGGGDASSGGDGMLKKARKSRQRQRQGISCSGSSDFDGVDAGSSDARARAARQKQRWRSSSAGAGDAAAARRSPQSSPERRGGGGMDRAAAAPMSAPHGRGDGGALPHASTSAATHDRHASAGSPGDWEALRSGPAAAAAAKAAVTTAADALLAVSQAASAAEAAAALAAVTAAADVAADAATTAAAASAACSSTANRAAAAAAEKSAAAAFQTLQYAQALRIDAARSGDGSAHLHAASPIGGGGGSGGVRGSSADADAADAESSAETAAGVDNNADRLAAALESASSAAAAAVEAALRIPLPWSVDSDAAQQPAAAAAAAAAAACCDSAADTDDAGYSGKRAAAAAGAQSGGAGDSGNSAAAAAAAECTDIAAAEPDAALGAAAAAARHAAECTRRRHPSAQSPPEDGAFTLKDERVLQDTGEETRRCVAALVAMRHVARHLHKRTSNAASAPAAVAGFRWHELVKDIDSCLNEHARRFRGSGKKLAKKPARLR